MVIYGGALPKEKQAPRKSPTSLIKELGSLQKMPDKDKALDILHKVAIQVAPLMRKHNLKVGLLREFHPKDPRLLGLNVNGGQKILLRLRPAHDLRSFLSFDDVVGTMLHEMVHNKIGPHNALFYKLLNEYKLEYLSIRRSSAFESTGYLAESERLGGRISTGRTVNDIRVGRLTSSKKYKSETRKLGAGSVSKTPKKSLKELIREAAVRRLEDLVSCAEERADLVEADTKDDDLEIEILREDKADYPQEFVFNSNNNINPKTDAAGLLAPEIKSEKSDTQNCPEIIDLTD